MSERVDTELDMTVLEALDFEPACELEWPDVHGDGENATHAGRGTCTQCGASSLRLVGPACAKSLLEAGGALCTCKGFVRVKLEPLS